MTKVILEKIKMKIFIYQIIIQSVPGMQLTHTGYAGVIERNFTRYLELISLIFASMAANPSSMVISPTTMLFK